MHFSFLLTHTADESMKFSKKSQLQESSAAFLKTQIHITDWKKKILVFKKLINTQEYLKKHALRKKIHEFFILDSNNDVEMHEMKAWKELSKNQQKKYKKCEWYLTETINITFLKFQFHSIQLLILKSLSSITQMLSLSMNTLQEWSKIL